MLDCQSICTHAGLRSRPKYITMAFEKGITLYTAGTPNGWKANMIVEELKVPYKLHAISLSDNEQKQEWFERINPNGRIPAIGKNLQAHFSDCWRIFMDFLKYWYLYMQLTMMRVTCQSLSLAPS
jgi:hypothetical protein